MTPAVGRAAQAQAPGCAPRFALLAWPLPALLVWAGAWGIHLGLTAHGTPAWVAVALASCAAALVATRATTPWRRRLVAAGFPLSWLAANFAFALPAWAWLLPLGLLALLYPMRSWRDAPLFPTPEDALAGLASVASLPPAARVVDLGCGLGAGLRELRREYPQAAISGVEWSWPLRWLCALRCRDARVAHGDIWAHDWSGYDLVYLFQRPESMARAAAKAQSELRNGAWLVSLEFEVPALVAQGRLEGADGRSVWLYQTPFVAAPVRHSTATRPSR
jgi:hypothetical protein